MKLQSVIDLFLSRRLKRQTRQYLRDLTQSSASASRKTSSDVLDRLGAADPTILLGHTTWGNPVHTSLDHVFKGHSFVSGCSGCGKTSFACGMLESLLKRLPKERRGFGLIDPKGDLFSGALFLLARRLKELNHTDPARAKELRRRIVICDFGSRDPITSYNLLSRPQDVEPDFFTFSRAEMLLDLLTGSDKLSLGGTAVLQKILQLLSEFNLPITYAEEVLSNPAMLDRLVTQSKNELVQAYFVRQFPDVPSITVSALQRRLSGLFASQGVRLALSGNTAPDMRRYMDEGRIVLINCFSPAISRDVRRLLQSLVLTDIRQAVFARRSPDNTFTWFADEAQNFFVTDSMCESMTDLLRMSRSFGTFFCFLTQNMAAAVPDARTLNTLYTNVRWSFSMRGEPSDSAFLKSAFPITGRRRRPKCDPFAAQMFCSPAEERGLQLDEIANLPDRTGWLWLRSETAEAIAMRTPDISIPSGREIDEAVAVLRRDPTIGGRISRKTYDRALADRERKWKALPTDEGDPDLDFAGTYQKMRGTKGAANG